MKNKNKSKTTIPRAVSSSRAQLHSRFLLHRGPRRAAAGQPSSPCSSSRAAGSRSSGAWSTSCPPAPTLVSVEPFLSRFLTPLPQLLLCSGFYPLLSTLSQPPSLVGSQLWPVVGPSWSSVGHGGCSWGLLQHLLPPATETLLRKPGTGGHGGSEVPRVGGMRGGLGGRGGAEGSGSAGAASPRVGPSGGGVCQGVTWVRGTLGEEGGLGGSVRSGPGWAGRGAGGAADTLGWAWATVEHWGTLRDLQIEAGSTEAKQLSPAAPRAPSPCCRVTLRAPWAPLLRAPWPTLLTEGTCKSCSRSKVPSPSGGWTCGDCPALPRFGAAAAEPCLGSVVAPCPTSFPSPWQAAPPASRSGGGRWAVVHLDTELLPFGWESQISRCTAQPQDTTVPQPLARSHLQMGVFIH